MAARFGRLTRRADFLRVAGRGRKWVTPGLIVQAAHSEAARGAEGTIRVGYTASRKVGSAVARNRARRRLRAAAAEVMPSRARPGHDYVLIARRTTLTRPYRALRGDLATALERLDAKREGARREVESAGP